MAGGRDAARHAGSMYRRGFARLRHPVREIEAEAEHLIEIEKRGESAETPLVAILGIVLFLLPIVALILGLAFAAYYLST
jgi:hypothetical protein